MTFENACNGMASGEAIKRPGWGGYVYKTDTTAEDSTTATFTLTFKNREGTEYVYTWNGTAWTAPETKVTFDAEIIEAMLADDWTSGTVAGFEAARAGTGIW